MIKIEITDRMREGSEPPIRDGWVGAVDLAQALEAMEPEAKRDLAAQLLRSANEAEGYEIQ